MTVSAQLDWDELPEHMRPLMEYWTTALNASLAYLFNGEQRPQEEAAFLYKISADCTAALLATGVQDADDFSFTINAMVQSLNHAVEKYHDAGKVTMQ